MFGGLSTIPNWFYILAFSVVIVIVLVTEWKTR
ncbi:Uncharacterised protein [Lysinibacillus sphaericus]|nr:Uncharacterised protein [Lysinibacillus sphaericus]